MIPPLKNKEAPAIEVISDAKRPAVQLSAVAIEMLLLIHKEWNSFK